MPVQPYQPSLAAAWLFQRSMALKPGQLREPRGRRGHVSGFLPPSHINALLAANFKVMQVCSPVSNSMQDVHLTTSIPAISVEEG